MYFKRVRDLREDNDLLQKDLAKLLNISQQYYSQYEIGHYNFSVEHIIKLAKFYRVNTDYILGLTEDRNPK